MKKFLIMRNDQQTGPYTLEQLKLESIQASDMVWVQGQSDKWTLAGEIDELKELLEAHKTQAQASSAVNLTRLSSLDRNSDPLDEKKELYTERSKTNKDSFYKTALLVSVLTVLVLGAILIKKSFEPEAVEIKDVANTPPGGDQAVTNAENFQNALSKEFIPLESKPKKIKPKELKKMVSVQVNDYEVKMLGGIKDLEITIQNFSDHLLDEVTVKVDYLKPKGEVLNSEMVVISDIKAGGSKTIEVPPSSRGVKIKYAITDIISKEYKAVLEEL